MITLANYHPAPTNFNVILPLLGWRRFSLLTLDQLVAIPESPCLTEQDHIAPLAGRNRTGNNNDTGRQAIRIAIQTP